MPVISIELEKNELNEIQSKQLHWSNLFDFDAIISFDYGEQKIHFETMHHLMTLGDLTKGIIVLLRSGKQSSYSGYGASYNKKLIIKRVKDRAFIELHIKKGDFVSAEVNAKVLALDFLRAIKNHIDYISSFQYDLIGAEELEGIKLLVIELNQTIRAVS